MVQLLGRGSKTPISGTRDERIFAIAAAQRNRVSRRQLLAAGISSNTIDRLARTRLLRRVHCGVFAVGPGTPIPLADETAALLAVRAGATLSHHTAAMLLGLRPPGSGDGLVHLTVPGASVEDPAGVRAHRSIMLGPGDVRVRDGLPVTSPARTLLDVAPLVSAREIERAIDQMVIHRIGTLRGVKELLGRAGHHNGRTLLTGVADAYTTTTFTRSEAEERFLSLIRDSGLPQPLMNVRRHGYEIDFFWPEERVAVEVDGFAYHGTRERFEEDRKRDAVLRKAGITVIRVTWRQLERHATAVVADVAQALARTAR
jgi:very-short-patch-repair endonuclease